MRVSRPAFLPQGVHTRYIATGGGPCNPKRSSRLAAQQLGLSPFRPRQGFGNIWHGFENAK
eukprot:6428247-Prymnesium_polylepis.1